MLSEVKKHIDSADINESVRTYVKRNIKKYLDNELLPGFIISRKTTEKSSSKTSADKIYFIRTPLSENQVILLRDAISVFPYAEQNKTADIVTPLNKLTPVYNREKYCPEIVNADKYRVSYYENLEEIRKAFAGVMGGILSTPNAIAAAVFLTASRKESVLRRFRQLSIKSTTQTPPNLRNISTTTF